MPGCFTARGVNIPGKYLLRHIGLHRRTLFLPPDGGEKRERRCHWHGDHCIVADRFHQRTRQWTAETRRAPRRAHQRAPAHQRDAAKALAASHHTPQPMCTRSRPSCLRSGRDDSRTYPATAIRCARRSIDTDHSVNTSAPIEVATPTHGSVVSGAPAPIAMPPSHAPDALPRLNAP
ncbi:MAG: hypothetical protein QOC89_2846 [Paraburkholderia sp.]|nr:hypothetical protein [Paraburkholderia sp.]